MLIVQRGRQMQLASRIKNQTVKTLASIAFFGIVGIIFLVLLPISGYPPHVGLMGITSIFAAYGLFFERKWAKWVVVALLFVATTFALYTLYFVLATDAIAAAGMIAYAVLTWIFTFLVVRKAKKT